MIVGFPGETDEDFDELCAYLERSPLTHLHVFPYSDRPGTAAAAMGGRVPGAVIRDRGRRIREVSARLAHNFRESQVGQVRPALTIEDGATVVTDNYLKLRLRGRHEANRWLHARIDDVVDGALLGLKA